MARSQVARSSTRTAGPVAGRRRLAGGHERALELGEARAALRDAVANLLTIEARRDQCRRPEAGRRKTDERGRRGGAGATWCDVGHDGVLVREGPVPVVAGTGALRQ